MPARPVEIVDQFPKTAQVLVKKSNNNKKKNNFADQPAHWTWQGGALSKRLLIVHSQMSCHLESSLTKRFKAKRGRVCTTGASSSHNKPDPPITFWVAHLFVCFQHRLRQSSWCTFDFASARCQASKGALSFRRWCLLYILFIPPKANKGWWLLIHIYYIPVS